MKPEDIMTRAINALMKSHPFYALPLLKHKLIWDDQQPTGYTDGKTLGTNTEWFTNTLNDAQRITYLAHEVEHICKLHHTRRNNRDAKLWNKAADYAINLILVDAGFAPLPNWLYDTKYRDMPAEQIYRLLQKEENDKKDQGSDQSNKGKKGQPSTGGDTIGEVRDAPNPQQAEQDVQTTIEQAKAIAKRMGKMPDAVERALGNVLKAGDPRDILAAFISDRARSNYSYSRPHRKYMLHEIYQPSIYNQSLGRFAVACDTSASISQNDIRKFVSFVLSCLSTLADYDPQKTIPVIYCDTKVQGVEELSDGDMPNPKGRGGTDFKPPFAYIDEQGEEIVGMLYMTDGDCSSFPDTPPPYPVIWCVLCGAYQFKPPFGEVVEISNML